MQMPPARLTVAVLAAAGGLTGLLSSLTEGLPPLPYEMQAQLTAVGINPHVMLPGVWFGLLTAAMAWLWGSRGVAGALVSLLVTWGAWHAAVQTGVAIFDRLTPVTDDEGAKLLAAGLLAGAVGALGTFLGLRVSVPFVRTPAALLATIAVGALAGLLLRWSMNKEGAGLLLYAAWQSAVAATLAYRIVRPPAVRAAGPLT